MLKITVYLFMTLSEIWWKKVPYKQKLCLFLEQTEWVIFKAMINGAVIDRRSLDGVAEAKLVMLTGGDRIDGKIKDSTRDAMSERSHWLIQNEYNEEHDVEFRVARMCFDMILEMDYACERKRNNQRAQFDSYGRFLILDFIDSSTRNNSPITRWMRKKGVVVE